ncbi:MAG: type II and III secretion system protein family protein [Pseudomonadota bacterium]
MDMKLLVRRLLGTTVSLALIAGAPGAALAQRAPGAPTVKVAQLPPGTQRPTAEVKLSVGQGELITLPANAANVWTSNPGVADVYVSSARQIHLYGKEFGEATVFATSANGTVIFATNVRVSQNLTSIDRMMKLAMPDADITVTTVGQMAVINGIVASPADSEQAQRLVTSLLNPGVDLSSPNAMLKIVVVNRLRTATPLQVNLQVRFAEVSRSFVKNVGVNLLTRDMGNGFGGAIMSGSRSPGTIGAIDTSTLPLLDASSRFGFPAGTLSLPYDPRVGDFVYPGSGTKFTATKGVQNTTLGLAGHLLGLDVLSAIDLGERIGQVTTLASPNLTALSGETATFLAGGEIPIPVSQGLGAVSVEYKQYGVSLAFTPTVMSDGRISIRVRPEVSQLSAAGAVTISGVTIPALTTRRAETSVELGSGESFMIAGLMSNSHDNNIDKAPGLGDVPILGALFRSNAFQRNETELVIVITPYLVKPVNANQIVLPTDGYQAPNDFERILGGQLSQRDTDTPKPRPSMAAPANSAPSVGALTMPIGPSPAQQQQRQQPARTIPPSTPARGKKSVASAAPGFGQ